MDGLDCFGADDIGFDWGAAAQTAGGVVSFASEAADKDKAEKKSSADDAAKVTAAINADVAASAAVAKADTTAPKVGRPNSPSASIDATAAQQAVAAQDRAGAALSSDGAQKRADAADKALADAVKRAQAKPSDEFLAAMVRAWQATANKAHNTSITSNDSDDDSGGKKGKGGKGKGKKDKDDSGKNWFVRPVLGPIPGAGVIAIGAGVLTGLGFAVKAIFFRHR